MGAETFFAELKRYVVFGVDEETALRLLAPHARPHFQDIAEAFYQRLSAHDAARRVFSGPEQLGRLKGTMVVWLEGLLMGPWDEAYFQRRARIGRRHVEIELPQHYMFGAMDHIRIALSRIANLAFSVDVDQSFQVSSALHKVLDMELAIMLETYREAFIERLQYLERLEKANLERRLAVTSARYDEVVEKGEALITTIDASGCILLFNAKSEAVTGVSRSAASGRPWLDLFASPSEREAVAARHRDALAGLPCHPYEGAVQTASGGERRVRWHFKTLLGPDAPLLCAIGVDVTEEHDLAIRTRHAERLASLSTMAAGLAHEIRNPLNAAHLQLSVAGGGSRDRAAMPARPARSSWPAPRWRDWPDWSRTSFSSPGRSHCASSDWICACSPATPSFCSSRRRPDSASRSSWPTARRSTSRSIARR